MIQADKDWIDKASYEDMLRKNRFAPVGDRMFTGDTGNYFMQVMAEKRDSLNPGQKAEISKRIGWL